MVDDTVYFMIAAARPRRVFCINPHVGLLARCARIHGVLERANITVDLLKRLNLAALAEALGRGTVSPCFTEREHAQPQPLAFAMG